MHCLYFLVLKFKFYVTKVYRTSVLTKKMKKSKFDKSNRNTLKIRYIRIVKKFVFDNTYIRLIINILRRHSGGVVL